MASLDKTMELIDELNSGGISFDIDAVMNESAENLLKQQGKSNPTSAEIKAVIDVWTKNPDGSEKKDVKRFYKIKLGEVSSKFMAVNKILTNIPTQFAGITATAGSGFAAPAAAPMFVAIKGEVNNACNLLSDALKICCELNIGAPDPLVALVAVLKTCKSLTGA